jgi:hypothetical protein
VTVPGPEEREAEKVIQVTSGFAAGSSLSAVNHESGELPISNVEPVHQTEGQQELRLLPPPVTPSFVEDTNPLSLFRLKANTPDNGGKQAINEE